MSDEELEKRIDESPSDFMQRELLRDTTANEEVRRTYDEVQSRAQVCSGLFIFRFVSVCVFRGSLGERSLRREEGMAAVS